MPRDGSGTYSLPAGSSAVTGTTISSSKYNALIDDLEQDANTARPISTGGTGAASATAARAALGVTLDNLSASSKVLLKSTNYTAVADDRSKLIVCTSDLTLALTAAATLADGWYVRVLGNGGSITIDPNGSETVNGAATLTIADGESVTLFCDGSNFHAAKAITEQTTGFDPTKIAETDASSATEVDFDLSSSAYTHFRVVISNLSVGTSGAQLFLRTSTDGGSSFDSGASDYRNQRLRVSGTTVTGSGGSDSKYICSISLANSNNNRAEILIYDAGGSVNTGISHSSSGVDSATFFIHETGGGERDDATAVDAIRLFPSTGNFSGKFTLYGMG